MGVRRLHVSLDVLVDFLKMREDWPRAYTVQHALPDDARLVEWMHSGIGPKVVDVWIGSEQWQGEGELPAPIVTVHLLDPVKMAQSLRDA